MIDYKIITEKIFENFLILQISDICKNYKKKSRRFLDFLHNNTNIRNINNLTT